MLVDVFTHVVYNTPLRVKGHARLAPTTLYEYLLPIVVARDFRDEPLGQALHLSELLVVGHQTRKLDVSQRGCGAFKDARIVVDPAAELDQTHVDGRGSDAGIV